MVNTIRTLVTKRNLLLTGGLLIAVFGILFITPMITQTPEERMFSQTTITEPETQTAQDILKTHEEILAQVSAQSTIQTYNTDTQNPNSPTTSNIYYFTQDVSENTYQYDEVTNGNITKYQTEQSGTPVNSLQITDGNTATDPANISQMSLNFTETDTKVVQGIEVIVYEYEVLYDSSTVGELRVLSNGLIEDYSVEYTENTVEYRYSLLTQDFLNTTNTP